MDVEVLRLYYGSVDGPFGQATPIHGYAIKHPDGVVLVDSGIGDPGGAEWATTYRLIWRAAEDALADHDLSLADVRYLVSTHLDHDHMGQNAYFKGIPTVVQERELAYARATQDAHSCALFDFPGAKIEPVDGDVELLEGVRLLWTPGHTPGHQSVWLGDADTGGELLIGDAAYTLDIFEQGDLPADHPGYPLQVREDPDLWRETIAKLQALSPTTVHFCHDSRIVGRTATAPAEPSQRVG